MDHQPENSVQPEDLTRHTNTPSLATPKHCPLSNVNYSVRSASIILAGR